MTTLEKNIRKLQWVHCYVCNKTRREDQFADYAAFQKPDLENNPGYGEEVPSWDKNDPTISLEGCCWKCAPSELDKKEYVYVCTICDCKVVATQRISHLKLNHKDAINEHPLNYFDTEEST